ncbi:MAG: DNA polymerase III subunit beta [Candidatus Brocadiales bacterium]
MKVVCSGDKLYEGLQLVGNIIATSTTKPILQAVKLETAGKMLEISGTDLEVGIRYLVEPIEIVKPGKVVLPGNRVMGLFKEWPEGEVQLEVKDGTCHLTGKGCNFRLLGYDAEEFPTIPSFINKEYFEIGSEKIGEMVRKTVFACASERLRHTMTGMLLSVKGDEVKMVATDGRRMAYVKERIRNKEGVLYSGIVPSKGIHQLPRIAAQSKGPLKIRLEGTHMLAKTENATLCSQLIEGQYPNYEEAIPKEGGTRLELNTEEFAAAVRRAAFLTTEERHVIKVKLQKNRVTVRAETPDIGEGEIGIETNYSGSEMEVGFNPDFLLDALKAIGKDPVGITFKDPNTAVSLRVGQDYLYVIMPIRLSEA